MKNELYASVIIFILLSGCSQEQEEYKGPPTMEGFIVEVSEDDILVVEGITKEKAESQSWKEIYEEAQKQPDAHLFDTDTFFTFLMKYKKGQKVKVWGKSGQADSYPPQSDAGRIEIVEE